MTHAIWRNYALLFLFCAGMHVHASDDAPRPQVYFQIYRHPAVAHAQGEQQGMPSLHTIPGETKQEKQASIISMLRNKRWWKWLVRSIGAAAALTTAVGMLHAYKRLQGQITENERRADARVDAVTKEFTARHNAAEKRQKQLIFDAHKHEAAARQRHSAVRQGQSQLAVGQEAIRQGQAKYANQAIKHLQRLRKEHEGASARLQADFEATKDLIVSRQKDVIDRMTRLDEDARQQMDIQLRETRGVRLEALEKEIIQTTQTVEQFKLGVQQAEMNIEQMTAHLIQVKNSGAENAQQVADYVEKQIALLQTGRAQMQDKLAEWEGRLKQLLARKEKLETAASTIQRAFRNYRQRKVPKGHPALAGV